jgi:hypothetical protein
MLPAIRLVVAVGSVCALVLGLVIVVVAGVAGIGGFWLIILGAVGLIGVAFERMRYRSEEAERSGAPAGAAGVEPGPADPRFRPTDERFVDPTTREQLRVWVDPASGERRYLRDE